jgi:hypothetical protein
MPSIISALAILGAAVLPDGADAAVPNGWVAQATLPDDGVSTFDPTKIVLTVQDYGFDGAGNLLSPGLGGPVRTIRGTARVRKQYPNNAQRLDSASGGVRTVYFALDDDIYQGTVIANASADAGYYGAAAAGTIGGIANNSTLAYPKPLFAWVNDQHERVNAATYNIEAVAGHRHAMNGRQVACIKYQARDAQAGPNLSAEVTANAPQLSAIQTIGPIAEVYAAQISTANLAQGDLCRINAKVYPWLGDASAVLDLLTDGLNTAGALATQNPQTPLRFLCDKTGAYGGACAIVKPGGTAATSAAVRASYALLGATLADAFPTVEAAIAAIQTYNNANKGHNNHSGGLVFVSEAAAGAGATIAIGASSASAAGLCWTDIMRDPAASGTVKLSINGAKAQVSHLRWRIPIDVIGDSNMSGGSGTAGNAMIGFRDTTLNYTVGQNAPLNFGFGLGFATNLTVTGGQFQYSLFSGFGVQRVQMRAVGLVANDLPLANLTAGFAAGMIPHTLIGLDVANWAFNDALQSANQDTVDGGVVVNCKFMKLQGPCSVATGGGTANWTRGFLLLQNVFERCKTANTPALAIGNDGTTVPFVNFVEHYTTIPGQGVAGANASRTNRVYADTAVGVIKRMTTRFSLFYDFNSKSDTFQTAAPGVSGRTGNWRYRYHVGNRGNVVKLGGDDGSIAPDPSGGGNSAGWLGEVWPADGKPGAAAVTFVNDQSGTANNGGGDYRIQTATSDAYARVAGPTTSLTTHNGAAVALTALTYDLAGVARRIDGSGAAGAYETTQNPPLSGTGNPGVAGPGGSGAGVVPVHGAGSGAVPGPAGSGGGGLTPIQGSGGGSVAGPGASGTGEVTNAPIVATGAIVAVSDRTISVSPIPSGASASSTLPQSAPVWAAPFDPADRAPYAIDWTKLLAAGETIIQIDRIAMSAEGASLGVQVDTAVARTPLISSDGKKTQVWFVCAPGFQTNAAFAGAGVQVGLSVLIRTSADPYKQYERTGVLIVRQQ